MNDNPLPDIARQALNNAVDLVRWDQELDQQAPRQAATETRSQPTPHSSPTEQNGPT